MQKINILFKNQIQKKIKVNNLLKHKNQIVYFYNVIVFKTYIFVYYYYYK
ncbi:hypothetical protein SIXOD_v1c26690 [Spiroplasma ixodetis Y32]|nr:hypothetical protein SIXOD_v1c26690 [Spiroplasma ixodetis Y32]